MMLERPHSHEQKIAAEHVPLSSPSPELTGPESSGAMSQVPRLPKILKFEALARCGQEVWIENSGQIYRLRKTKQGKLILTK